MTDERQGLPSASSAHRIHACPGYLNLVRSLPARADESSPDAESGTRIAEALAGTLDPTKLNDDESKVFDRLMDGRSKIRQAVFTGEGDAPSVTSEKRLWLEGAGDRNVFSGRFDVCYILGTTALIIDDKSGRNEVTKAEGNLQLRALAVLVQANLGTVMFTRIAVAINQPWFSPPFSIAEYNQEDLDRAHRELLSDLADAEKPDAPRIPGKHCLYCPAMQAAACPEAREYSLTPPAPNLPADRKPAEIVATLDGQTLAAFLERSPMAKKIIEAVEKEAKARLEADPESIPGYYLKPNSPLTPINDSEAVFARAERLGVKYPQFIECVSIGKEKLETLVKSVTGQKGEALEATMEALTEGCTGETPRAPSLAKIEVTP